jgi:hypothetical protein
MSHGAAARSRQPGTVGYDAFNRSEVAPVQAICEKKNQLTGGTSSSL